MLGSMIRGTGRTAGFAQEAIPAGVERARDRGASERFSPARGEQLNIGVGELGTFGSAPRVRGTDPFRMR